MRPAVVGRRLAPLVVAALFFGACADDSDESAPPDDASSFCTSVSNINDALDFFGAAFLANDQDGSADELRAVLTDAVAVLEDAVAFAPNDQAEAAQTIRDAYRSFQSALNDVDYVVAELDATDERLAPLADPALSAAIVSVNEACL